MLKSLYSFSNKNSRPHYEIFLRAQTSMSTPVEALVITEITRDHFDFEGRIVSL